MMGEYVNAAQGTGKREREGEGEGERERERGGKIPFAVFLSLSGNREKETSGRYIRSA
jgi:hypothetical protein